VKFNLIADQNIIGNGAQNEVNISHKKIAPAHANIIFTDGKLKVTRLDGEVWCKTGTGWKGLDE
jgi:hypothetical protein